jgi:AraC-like DNA-binding protein
VICALSKGAHAGVALAARLLTRVDRIVVVNAFMLLTPDDEAKRLALYAILAQKGGARLWAEQLLNSMGVANRLMIVRGFLKCLDEIDPEHTRSIFRELIAYDQRPALKDATCSAPLVRGEEDGFVPSYCVEELHYGLTDRHVVQLPAQVAGLSRMHFAKQFRAATGYRPHNYLLYQRIEIAKATLSSTDTPLAEIALDAARTDIRCAGRELGLSHGPDQCRGSFLGEDFGDMLDLRFGQARDAFRLAGRPLRHLLADFVDAVDALAQEFLVLPAVFENVPKHSVDGDRPP